MDKTEDWIFQFQSSGLKIQCWQVGPMALQRGCHCLAHSAGRWSSRGQDLPVPCAVRKAMTFGPPGPGACLSSFYCTPACPVWPSSRFSSPAAFTVTLPLSAFLAALQTIRLLPHRCNQLLVHVAASLWSPLNLQWPHVKTRLWINVIICVLGDINNSINISKFTGQVTYITLIQ